MHKQDFFGTLLKRFGFRAICLRYEDLIQSFDRNDLFIISDKSYSTLKERLNQMRGQYREVRKLILFVNEETNRFSVLDFSQQTNTQQNLVRCENFLPIIGDFFSAF
jgi:hypothetical protein